MDFYSSFNPQVRASLKEAIFQGLAPDGGLFMPGAIPRLPDAFFADISQKSLLDIAFEVAYAFLEGAISPKDLQLLIEKALPFDAPVVQLDDRLFSLELFHGPSLSFKDFGACFMAQLMEFLNKGEDKPLNILVATSGDTGSAVGCGFYNVPGFKVWILYPKGQVSTIQEQQLTTIGGNVQALEVDGAFDDCQALVKQAFQDKELTAKVRLSSANSINIARLIPQIFYYMRAYAQVNQGPVIFSVPSGNFGNLTAGLLAKRMGLPVAKFVAATNANDSVPQYLKTGIFQTHPSIHTLSNAMDVGNPSNFSRMLDLYGKDVEAFRREIVGFSFTDAETLEAIRELDQKYSYIADPHGAIAYKGLTSYQRQGHQEPGIFLETAHPAKFLDVVQPVVNQVVSMPKRLKEVQDLPKQAVSLPPSYDALRALLS